MHGDSFQEAVQGMSSSMGKVRPKAVATNVFHLVLIWERGDGALRIFLAEILVKENEVRETATDLDRRFLEGGEISL